MDFNIILGFVRPELFILIVFIYSLGLFLKKTPWFTCEWKIPFILLGVSVLFSVLYVSLVSHEGFTGEAIISAIIQGVIIASLSVFGNETIKQYFNKRFEDETK